jgi:hypothetical protein
MRNTVAKRLLPVAFALAAIAAVAWPAGAARHEDMSVMAQTPPMGWNSWDSWGMTINEAQFRDTVTWFHNHLEPYGWQYVVIDEGWFAQHPESPAGQQDYTLGKNGRYWPAVDRFPSAAGGKGFAPLAGWVHFLGLKFGIHIVRGIPRQVVEENLPIAHSHFRASQAADTTDTCAWNSDNYGVRDNKAGQAYYDSLFRLYASWGVDFVKVDCISSPWHGAQIAMIHRAIQRSGRPILLSLSPGPTPLADAQAATANAEMWRISDDMWDVWSKPSGSPRFPQTLRNQFALLASWESWAAAGHWPDADMLPIGYLGPHPGWGQPRKTRLTDDEVRTMMTLWAIARAPLFIGTNLLKMDAFTDNTLTNAEVISVDQFSQNNHPVIQSPKTVVWMAEAPEHGGDYIALFNLSDKPQIVTATWQQLGIVYGKCPVRDLWQRKELGYNTQVSAMLAPHASALFLAQHP